MTLLEQADTVTRMTLKLFYEVKLHWRDLRRIAPVEFGFRFAVDKSTANLRQIHGKSTANLRQIYG